MQSQIDHDDAPQRDAGRVNRLYAVLSNVNEAIVRTREPLELYEAACRIAVEDGHFLLAWIGFVESDSAYIRPVAVHGRDEGYLDSVRISLSEDVPEGRGPTGVALREGRPFINNDTANNPVMRPWRDEQLKRGFRSSASFPLKTGGKTIGAITLYAGLPNYFDVEEVRLLGCLADDFSFALESAETARQRHELVEALAQSRADLQDRVREISAAFEDLIDQRTRQATYAEALNRINDGVHSTLDVDEIMNRAVLQISDVLGVDAVVLQVHKGDHWEFEYEHGLPADLRFERLPDADVPLSMEVLRTRAPVVVNDVATDHRVNAEIMKRFGITSLAAVPLFIRDEVFGVLIADRFGKPAAFEREQVDFLRNAATVLALGLENARLFAAQREAQRVSERRLAQTTLLNAVAVAATTSTSLSEVADRVLQAIDEAVDTKIGAIYLYDQSSRMLTLLAQRGLDAMQVERVRSFEVGEASPVLISKAVLERRVVSGNELPMTPARRALLQETGLTGVRNLAVPIELGGVVLGTASFVFEREVDFSSVDAKTFDSLAGIVGQAIENARLFEATQESARLSDALNSANKAVHSTLDIEQVMQHALETGVQALECEAGAIEMLEGAEWVVRYQVGFSKDAIGTRLSAEEAPNAARAAMEGAPLAIETMAGDERINVGFVRQHNLKSVLAVPLTMKTAVIGCAMFYTREDERHFTDSEIDFGRKLGAVVSLALENARIYGLEHGIAATLQEALLSLPDRISGIEFAPFYQSATEHTLVGGDFYDLFELSGGLVGITIGDISGKGLKAAALTSLVKNTIHAHAHESGKSPGQILALTNDIVLKSTPVESFATVFFGVLDRGTGRLTYTNAGHTTGALLRNDGSLEKLLGTAPIIGGFADIVVGEEHISLEPGELLFLYTDGLTEARRDRELYGEDRLFEMMSSIRAQGARDAVATVMADVMSFAGNRLRDDLAILAVRRVEA